MAELRSLGSPTQKEVESERELRQFLTCYDEFQKRYNASSYLNRENEDECYLTIGVTGAGKSTTIARLLNDLEPREFVRKLEEVKSNRTRTVTISDVKIGADVVSTTIIPQIYTIPNALNDAQDHLHICDMPGLFDVNSTNQAIIDVLHKIILTRVRRPRYLIVVNVKFLKDITDTKGIGSTYSESLEKMFGVAQYINAISNFFFVLTCPEDRNEVDIAKLLTAIVIRFSGKDGRLVSQGKKEFFNRMLAYHCVVNLNVDTQASLLKKLVTMIQSDEDNGVNSTANAGGIPWSLEAGEGQLNALCVDWVTNLMQQVRTYSEDIAQLRAEVSDFEASIKKDAIAMIQGYAGIQNDYTKSEETRRTVEDRLNRFEGLVKSLEKELQEKQQKLSMDEQVLNKFNQEIVESDLIDYRCDETTTGSAAGDYIFNVRAPIGSRDGKLENWEAFVVEFEANDATVAALINKAGQLIPDSLSVFSTFTHSNVLFSTAIRRFPDGFKHNLEGGRVFTLCATLKRPAKLFIYTSRKFRNSPQHKKLQAEFETPKLKTEERIVYLTNELRNLAEENQNDKKLREELLRTKSSLTDKEAKSKEHIKKRLGELHAKIVEYQNKFKSFEGIFTTMNEQKIKHVEQIRQIFADNRIDTKLEELVKDFKSTIGGELSAEGSTSTGLIPMLKNDQSKLKQLDNEMHRILHVGQVSREAS